MASLAPSGGAARCGLACSKSKGNSHDHWLSPFEPLGNHVASKT